MGGSVDRAHTRTPQGLWNWHVHTVGASTALNGGFPTCMGCQGARDLVDPGRHKGYFHVSVPR